MPIRFTAFTAPTPLRVPAAVKPAAISPRVNPAGGGVCMKQANSRRAVIASFIAASTMFFLKSKWPLSSARSAPAVEKTDEEWRQQLTADQYRVLRQAGTERSFTSPLNDEKRIGVYKCAACGSDLFSSETKYNSGTGWPSFFKPLKGGIVFRQTAMDAMLMQKEVLCKECNGHLGHMFKDGPRPTGERYCMNGVALQFVPSEPE